MSFSRNLSPRLHFGGAILIALVGCGKNNGVAGPLLGSTLRAYVANTGDRTLSAFRIDSKSQNTVQLGDVTLPDPPTSLAIDRQGRFLFAGSASTGSIMTMAIDAESGALTYRSKLAIGSGFRRLLTHPSLNALYALDQANTNNVKFLTYSDATGFPALQSQVTAGTFPRAAALSPSGRSLLVAGYTSNTLVPVSLNPSTGAPTAGTSVATGVFPESVVISRDGAWVFVGNDADPTNSSIRSYPYIESSASLGAPVTHAVPTSPIALAIHPFLDMLLVGSFTTGVVNGYGYSASDGVLTFTNSQTPGDQATSMQISSDGNSAMVVNAGSSNSLSVLKLDGATLGIFDSWSVGSAPADLATFRRRGSR